MPNRDPDRKPFPSGSNRLSGAGPASRTGVLTLRVFSAALLLLPLIFGPVTGQVVSVVEVRVTSRVTGDPIPGASVSVLESGGSSVTDGRGLTTLRGLPPGRHRLLVRALGYRESRVDLEAANGRRTRVSVFLVPDPLELRGFEVATGLAGLHPEGYQLTPADLSPAIIDLPDALENVPGVTVVQRGGAGSPATIQVRGASPGQVLVLLDGVPLNSPLTGEADLSTVDLGTLERILVLPGAQSARYGPRALGGVVLLESRSMEESAADLSLGAGSWGARQLSGGGSWSPDSVWTLSAHGDWSTSEGDFLYEVPDFRGGGEERRKNAGFDRTAVRLTLERRRHTTASALRFDLSELQRGSPGPTAQPALLGEQIHRRTGVSFRTRTGGGESGGSVILALQRQRAEYSDPAPPVGRAYDQQSRVSHREVGLAGWHRMGPVLARLGGDLRSRKIRADVLTGPSTSLREAGLWTQLEMDRAIAGIGRGRLSFGLRADGHGLVNGAQFSPNVSAVFAAWGARIELAYRNAFSPPALADLFFQEGVLARPNPDLRPERVKGEIAATVETGIRLGRSHVEARVSAYRSKIDDMIFWFPDFQFVWSPTNVDVFRNGIEVGSVIRLTLFGRDHYLTGDASWAHVEYRGGVVNGQVAYRPVFTATSEGRLDLPLGSLTLRANHVGTRRSVAGSDLNSLSPYTVLDLGWSSDVRLGGVAGRIELALSNLLDERAALLVDYPLPSRGWSTRIHLKPTLER